MEKDHVVGILVGEKSSEEEKSFFERRQCPYKVLCASSGTTVVSVFTIPPDHKWWLEGQEKQPVMIGLTRAEVFFTERVDASSSWSSGEVTSTMDNAPCGAQCGSCPFYHNPCEGCPATKYYREDNYEV